MLGKGNGHDVNKYRSIIPLMVIKIYVYPPILLLSKSACRNHHGPFFDANL